MPIKRFFFAVFILFLLSVPAVFAQFVDLYEIDGSVNIKRNRSRGLNMLSEIKEAIKQRYYDKNYHGIDLDKRFAAAEEKIKTLSANGDIFRVIAQVVLEFNDSHTRFIPPSRANQVEYGFLMQMIGNDCFIVDVKKGSDAEAKGLRIGNIVTGVGPYAPTRGNLWKLNYMLYSLVPQEKLKLRVINSDNSTREVEIQAAFKSLEDRKKEAKKKRQAKQENPYKCQKINSEIIACRLETFSVDKKHIDKMMAEVSPYKNFVLDLRGNGGGYVVIEEYLTGHFFDRDVKIATFITRGKTKERIAKSRGEKVFKGGLAVLIDSESASASEVFARIIQLEKRGKVVGDVSAGAVMTSNIISMADAHGTVYSFFGLNLTVADLIMSDGNRLENAGVIPDHPVGPTGEALFVKSDPVLAYAANLFGAKLTGAEAGKFHFMTKKDENEEAETDEGEN